MSTGWDRREGGLAGTGGILDLLGQGGQRKGWDRRSGGLTMTGGMRKGWDRKEGRRAGTEVRGNSVEQE